MSDAPQNLQLKPDQALCEIQHYRKLLEDLGRNRLREIENYSQLLKKHLETEKELSQIQKELEERIQQRTAALTLANQKLQQEMLERSKLEQQFRLFMKHFPGLAYIKDSNHKCIYANEGFHSYLGLNPDSIIGKANGELFPADFARKIDADDENAIHSNLTLRIEEEFAGKHWASYKFPIYKPGGQVLLGGLTLDITELKLAENNLREKEEFIRDILDSSKDLIWTCNVHGVFTYCNPAIEHVLGYQQSEIIGHSLFEYIYGEDRAHIESQFSLCMEKGTGWHNNTIRWSHRNGNYRLLESNSVPILDKTGEILGLRSVDRDVTERRKLEEERLNLEKRILQNQKLESLGVLAGGIAHDFNNLLMSIQGNTDLALFEISHDHSSREYLQNIQTAIKRAADLCSQMLAYSGKGRFFLETINLNSLIQESLTLVQNVHLKSSRLILNLSPQLSPIRGDISQVRQLLINLLVNAVEATGNTGGAITINTGSEFYSSGSLKDSKGNFLPEGFYAWLEVADSGCGMTPDTIDRIFDPFFTTKFVGRGLGLPAVMGIVQAHHGALSLKSALGKGSCFRAFFPAAPEPVSAPIKTDAMIKKAMPFTGAVLFVDDEISLRKVAKRLLERMGYLVLVAADGDEGLTTFSQHKEEINLILLDLTMPGKNGYQTLKEIRKIDSNIPVFIMSGYSETELPSDCNELKLTGFLQKPFDMDKLKNKLRDLSELKC